MANVSITVPGVGESITEGILSRWLKPDGSAVKAGEPLYELETDKASNVVPAPSDGVLTISAREGDTVAIGAEIGTLDPAGSPAAAPSAPTSTPAKPAAPPERSSADGRRADPPASDGNQHAPSPAVRRIAAEEQVELSKVEGTGKGGRVTKGDVLSHLAEPAPTRPANVAAATLATTAPEPPMSPRTSPALGQTGDRETRKRMTGIRQKIAQRLVEVQHTAAILTTFNEADMSRVMDLRTKYKEPFNKKHGINLGFMSFFVRAAVAALKAFPAVNGRVDGNELVFNNYFDIGVAVSTERGLMVPVLRNADQLSFVAIEKGIADFAKRSRDNAITVADLQGGTFTITNGGIFGSLLSTPILNPPQSGILGMHTIQKRPVAINDQVVIRPMMYLALSYDHRMVDGREAVNFLVKLKEGVENPERLMLDI
ncbi:MAG: 2-oxoglutarate dehydrogenase complex dihydrolipoyllysine-residue succinyltransferase [Isosphaeraceae bacterium]